MLGFSANNKKNYLLTRVNSANMLDNGLRIGGRGRRMNSKVRMQANKAELDVY
jgi:hypothetical protein